MATDDQTVRVIFEAVDRYSNVAGRVQQNMQAMSGSAKQLVVSSQAVGQVTGWEELEAKLLAATGGMNAASAGAVQVASSQAAAGHAAAAAGSQIERAMSGQAAPSIQNVASKAMGLVKQFTVLSGAIVGFSYTLKKALDFAEAGSRVINLERSFESFAATAGTTGNAVLEAMVTASNGMLSEAQAMQQYSRTYLLAGQEIANQMPQMIKVALAASAAGMGDFNYMIESLVTGLGRLSPLILDNLGLSISLEEAYASYARTIGKTTDELSKGEQQMAVWTQVQEQMVAKMGDLDAATAAMAGQGVAQLKAAWTNFIDYVEVKAAPTIDSIAAQIAGVMATVPSGMPRVEALIADLAAIQAGGLEADAVLRRLRVDHDDIAGSIATVESWLLEEVAALDLAGMSTQQYREVLAQIESVSPRVAAEFAALYEQAGIAAQQNKILAEAATHTGLTLGDVARQSLSASNAMSATTSVAELLASSMGLVAANGEDAAAALGKVAQVYTSTNWRGMAGISAVVDPRWLRELPGSLRQVVNEEPRLLGTLTAVEAELGKNMNALDAVNEAARAAGRSATAAWNDMQSQMEQYYESWQSQAEGILTPTQQFDLAALTEEVSGYQEQWDEAARRAMAVVKGGPENEWAAQMGLGSREEALQYVRDFYAGKMPEAVNWDAAIATFQQQMEQTVGQQNLGAMFQQKLMEAGLGLDNELVMQAMGAPFAAAGAGSAEEFALAVQQYDWATLGDDPGKSFATSFLGAAGSALSSPGSTAGFKNSIKSFIISTVQEYFFGGAKP